MKPAVCTATAGSRGGGVKVIASASFCLAAKETCGVPVAPGTAAHKSDRDPPLRLNSLDYFMIAKAARKYERRGVITCGTGEGGG